MVVHLNKLGVSGAMCEKWCSFSLNFPTRLSFFLVVVGVCSISVISSTIPREFLDFTLRYSNTILWKPSVFFLLPLPQTIVLSSVIHHERGSPFNLKYKQLHLMCWWMGLLCDTFRIGLLWIISVNGSFYVLYVEIVFESVALLCTKHCVGQGVKAASCPTDKCNLHWRARTYIQQIFSENHLFLCSFIFIFCRILDYWLLTLSHWAFMKTIQVYSRVLLLI